MDRISRNENSSYDDGDSSFSSYDNSVSDDNDDDVSSLSPDTDQETYRNSSRGANGAFDVNLSVNVNSRGGDAAAVRRRGAPLSLGARSGASSGRDCQSDPEDGRYLSNTNAGHRHRHRRHGSSRRTRPSSSSSCWTKLRRTCRKHSCTVMRQVPTMILILCFIFWLAVQTTNVYGSVSQSTINKGGGGGRIGTDNRSEAQRNAAQRNKNRNGDMTNGSQKRSSYSVGSLFGDAVEGFWDIVGIPAKALRQVSNRGEALAPGCSRSPWQEFDLPNCNDMHETDLYASFSGRERKDGGYVGNGYWRHVWLVDPRHESNVHQGNNRQHNSTTVLAQAPAPYGVVLKMMKKEHKVEARNFDRHRRDALAMERLTSAPNIVDIYSFCGNSVLTEYVGSDMHKVLYHTDEKGRISDKVTITQRSDKEKLQLAIDVTRGVAALHEVEGGPIVHADIADKQFLVDDNGRVKLNDFNRCRFMGHKTTTNEKCSFRIPSAPGRHRSPEEYEDEELTEQLDVYSTAHVLYGILTGEEPWSELPSSQVKRAVKRGTKPTFDDKFRKPGTTDAILASLIDKAYDRDPELRISAPDLVAQLELALQKLTGGSTGLLRK